MKYYDSVLHLSAFKTQVRVRPEVAPSHPHRTTLHTQLSALTSSKFKVRLNTGTPNSNLFHPSFGGAGGGPPSPHPQHLRASGILHPHRQSIIPHRTEFDADAQHQAGAVV